MDSFLLLAILCHPSVDGSIRVSGQESVAPAQFMVKKDCVSVATAQPG